jgi:hypothetical protein
MMIPEMLPRFFSEVVLHGELADLPLQLGDATGVIDGRQRGASPPDSGKGQVTLGTPFASPALQQVGTHLILARKLPGGCTGVEGAHGGDFEIAAVGSSGEIHFFQCICSLTRCLSFEVHSLAPNPQSPPPNPQFPQSPVLL